MAELQVEGSELVLQMSALEKAEGLHRDIRVPRRAVTSVRVVDDAGPERCGMRAPGTGVPNLIAVGIGAAGSARTSPRCRGKVRPRCWS